MVAGAALRTGVPPGQLLLRLCRQAVYRYPGVVTSGAAQRDMLFGAVCARETETLRDLSGGAALGACDDR